MRNEIQRKDTTKRYPTTCFGDIYVDYDYYRGPRPEGHVVGSELSYVGNDYNGKEVIDYLSIAPDGVVYMSFCQGHPADYCNYVVRPGSPRFVLDAAARMQTNN